MKLTLLTLAGLVAAVNGAHLHHPYRQLIEDDIAKVKEIKRQVAIKKYQQRNELRTSEFQHAYLRCLEKQFKTCVGDRRSFVLDNMRGFHRDVHTYVDACKNLDKKVECFDWQVGHCGREMLKVTKADDIARGFEAEVKRWQDRQVQYCTQRRDSEGDDCENRACKKYDGQRLCQCNNACKRYGDCCKDKDEYCPKHLAWRRRFISGATAWDHRQPADVQANATLHEMLKTFDELHGKMAEVKETIDELNKELMNPLYGEVHVEPKKTFLKDIRSRFFEMTEEAIEEKRINTLLGDCPCSYDVCELVKFNVQVNKTKVVDPCKECKCVLQDGSEPECIVDRCDLSQKACSGEFPNKGECKPRWFNADDQEVTANCEYNCKEIGEEGEFHV